MTICSQVEFKAAVFPDKEDDFVMIKVPTHQEDKIILNVHISKYVHIDKTKKNRKLHQHT